MPRCFGDVQLMSDVPGKSDTNFKTKEVKKSTKTKTT